MYGHTRTLRANSQVARLCLHVELQLLHLVVQCVAPTRLRAGPNTRYRCGSTFSTLPTFEVLSWDITFRGPFEDQPQPLS